MQSNKNHKGAIRINSLIRLTIKIILIYGAVITLILLLRQVSVTRAAEEPPTVSFCEIMPNPEGTDTKNNEYIKLKNNTSGTVDLSGWKICNISQDCYLFQESLSPENCNKIYRTSFVFTLHNDKEELTLFDKNVNLVDKINTDLAPSGKAWQCYQENCAWGEPQDSCDYSFLGQEEIPAPDNTHPNENPSETNENNNNDSLEKNEQANNNANISNKPGHLINDKKDFPRLRKILRKEKLASVPVNIRGAVALPPGLMAKTYFYFSFKDELIKIHIYSSCQNSPTCLRDIELIQNKKLAIQNAALKIIDGRFELFLDKNTFVVEEKNKKLKKANKIHVSGNIVAKRGDYFFVEDSINANLTSVYIPKSLQNAYAKKLDSVPLGYFPFYSDSVPSKSWIGGKIDANGVIETVGEEERLIAYKLNELEPASNEPGEKGDPKKEKEELKKLEKAKTNDKTEDKKIDPSASAQDDRIEEEKTSSNKIDKEKFKTILVKNLSWQSLWSIFLTKLTSRITSFSQYF